MSRSPARSASDASLPPRSTEARPMEASVSPATPQATGAPAPRAAAREPPRVGGLDATLALRRDPYRFIARHCRAAEVDVAEARVLLHPTLLLTGPLAGALFYDPSRFVRAGAAPRAVRSTLFGHGTVQSLDGAAHALRKRQLMAELGPASTDFLLARTEVEWARAAERWRGASPVRLYEALQPMLARAACAWAGVPLGRGDEAEARVAALVALFDDAGGGPLRHLGARRSRRALERWLGERVEAERRRPGSGFTAGTPAAALARAAMVNGTPLPVRVAAAEILNLIRPTVAVAVWIVFALHAVHTQPAAIDLLRSRPDDAARTAVIQEVRRHYPFSPAVMARVRTDFEWQGICFRRGRRAMFDLYGTNHDPRAWPDPEAFRPERFLGLPDPPRHAFVPQGGGRADSGHRCPGEQIAVRLGVQALAWLGHRLPHELPAQDLSIAFGRLPAIPRDGMRVRFL